MRTRILLHLSALVLLLAAAGCGSAQSVTNNSTGQPPAKPAGKALGTPQCGLYTVTLAVALLRQHDAHLPPAAKLRPAWGRVLQEPKTPTGSSKVHRRVYLGSGRATKHFSQRSTGPPRHSSEATPRLSAA